MGIYDVGGRTNLTLSPGTGFLGLYATDGSWYYTPATASGFLGLYAPDGSIYVTDATGSTDLGLFASNGSLRVTTGSDNNGALKVSGLYVDASEAIFAEFTTPPSVTNKVNINRLVVTLQSASIWDNLDLLYVLAAADSQAALINWKNPGTKTLSAVNSPTFTAYAGYAGNGTTSRLNTAWTPSTEAVKYTLNNASVWVWSRTNSQAAVADIGSVGAGTDTCQIRIRTAANVALFGVNSATSSVANTSSSGLFGSQRRASNDLRLFVNGVQTAGVSLASGSLPSLAQWICGGDSTHFSARQLSFAAWGASLSGTEASFYAAVSAYMQAVGAA